MCVCVSLMPLSVFHDVCVCVADIRRIIIDGGRKGVGLRYMGMPRGRKDGGGVKNGKLLREGDEKWFEKSERDKEEDEELQGGTVGEHEGGRDPAER